jgi:NitT/TauT family transport system permease protein
MMPGTKMINKARNFTVVFDRSILVIAAIAAWAVIARLVGSQVLTGPLETTRYLGNLFLDPDFLGSIWETAKAFFLALLIAWSSGVVIGIVLGAHRLTGEVAEPILAALYSIPKITLYPVILLMFGLSLSARVAFGAIHGVIPVALFTMAAVRGIRPIYFRAAKSLNLGLFGMASHIILPASLPGIMSGLRVGFALTLLGTLIGEMFASQRGLGHLLADAMHTDDTKLLMAIALLLVLVATTAGSILLMIDNRLHRHDI